MQRRTKTGGTKHSMLNYRYDINWEAMWTGADEARRDTCAKWQKGTGVSGRGRSGGSGLTQEKR